MGLFGNRGLTAAQQVARGGDGTSMAAATPSGPNWARIAGIVGDGLSGLAGQPGTYAKAQYARQDQAAQLQREMQLAQYKAQNPEPTGMQRNYEYLKQQNPDLAESYLRAEANPQTLMTDPATGNVTFQPKGGPAPSVSNGPPPEAQAYLKAHPELRDHYEAKYGPGSASQVLGN